jgi:hypothetical protein
MKPFRNRPGTGRIQRAIKRAFWASSGAVLTTRQIAEFSHPRATGKSWSERLGYCRAVRRAADRLCVRVGKRSGGRGERYHDGVLWRLRE